ncbi:MAG: PepSY domain-containing protein, partial [Cyclobacteriaceae bacterium]|nr:PepSY domain-containing protein [Cyclobacteriaceae bacterium]
MKKDREIHIPRTFVWPAVIRHTGQIPPLLTTYYLLLTTYYLLLTTYYLLLTTYGLLLPQEEPLTPYPISLASHRFYPYHCIFKTIMLVKDTLKKQTKRLRRYRKWHKYVGLSAMLFVLISSISGLLLGWKKDAQWLQPAVPKVAVEGLDSWVTASEMARLATDSLEALTAMETLTIDRIDIRPSKGVAKVVFEQDNWEVQVHEIG